MHVHGEIVLHLLAICSSKRVNFLNLQDFCLGYSSMMFSFFTFSVLLLFDFICSIRQSPNPH